MQKDNKRWWLWLTIIWLIAAALVIVAVKTGGKSGVSEKPCSATLPEVVVLEKVEKVKPENATEAMGYLREAGYLNEKIPLPEYLQIPAHMAADEFGVPYHILLGLMQQETKFRNLIGDNGNSLGYCQIQPRWWSSLMKKIGADDLMDAEDNFRTCCAILKRSHDSGMEWREAVAQYNPGNPDYADLVLEKAEHWKEVLSK